MADSTIASTPSAWRVRQLRDGDSVRIVGVEPTAIAPAKDAVTLQSLPSIISEDAPPPATRYEEVVYTNGALPKEARAFAEAAAVQGRRPWPGSEVRTIASSGQIENRINLTIVGDGYTAAQKDQFFADAQRMTDDLFSATTFKSYLPLFNVHAVFVPSNQSGLTDGSDERDTALGLYRSPAGSKRGIMPGNPDAIDRAVALAPATDYPILMANDDFYGGLGGQYAITTRSERSGKVVLRHELGHNFGNVGEEYDGGYVYDGANHSDSADVPWKAWVDGDLQAFSGKPLVGEYPWRNLKEGPINYTFKVEGPHDGQRPSLRIDGSFVGWETKDDVQFLLDGKPIEAQIDPTNDRGFFLIGTADDIAPGKHKLTVQEKVADGDNQLASIRVTQYQPGYDFTPGKIGAFPSFNDWGSMSGYRPTHESCLMRDMTNPEFCAIDKENMWHQFLERVSLIDGLSVGIGGGTGDGGDDGDGGDGGGDNSHTRVIALRTPSLDGLQIKWSKVLPDGQEEPQPKLNGKKRWRPADDDHSTYRVHVSYATPEVRTYDEHFTASRDVKL